MLQYFLRSRRFRNVSGMYHGACIMLLVGVDVFNQNILFSQLKKLQFIELTLIILSYYTTQKFRYLFYNQTFF